MPSLRKLNLTLPAIALLAAGAMGWISRSHPDEGGTRSVVAAGRPALKVIRVPGRISALDGSRLAAATEDEAGQVTIAMSPGSAQRLPFSGVKFTSASSVHFDGRRHWFACFDNDGRFFYGVPGAWVNRLDETVDSTSAQTLPRPEAEAFFRELEKQPGES